MKKISEIAVKMLAIVAIFSVATPAFAVADPEFGYGGDPVSCTMVAIPDTIGVGGGTTLDWTTSSNVVSAKLSPKGSTSWMQSVPVDGTWYISGIVDTREYTLTVTGPEGQTATCDALINVETDSSLVAPSCDIEAVPSTIVGGVTPDGSTTVVWESSDNAVSATLHPKGSTDWTQSVPLNGSWYFEGIVDSREYTLTVETASGLTADCDAPITVVADTAPTCSMIASPDTIEFNGGTSLVWESSDNVVAATLHPQGSTSYFANVTPSGSWWISGITNTRGYSVTVTSAGGQTATCDAIITVDEELAS
jgi:ABC-type thiamin/hydroxymethylpyrimidine transport system permease subunit